MLNWNFLGGERVQNKKTFQGGGGGGRVGGSMDIFWNCILLALLHFACHSFGGFFTPCPPSLPVG